MVEGFPWWWRAGHLGTTWQFRELLLVLDISLHSALNKLQGLSRAKFVKGSGIAAAIQFRSAWPRD